MYEAQNQAALSTTGGKNRQPEIHGLLENMEKSTGALQNLVGQLSERLAGVLQPEANQANKPVGELERALPPVLQAISGNNRRLRSLNDQVESLLARLEL